MTLTLDEVRKTKFHMARRTGYEVSEVDLFVDRVEASFAQLTEENQMLKQQVETLKQAQTRQPQQEQPADSSGKGQPKKAAETSRSQPAVPAIDGVQKLVVSTSAEASPAVIRLVQLATEQSEQLVKEASDDARRKLEEANQKAEQITGEARTNADRVTTEARNRAADLDRQTQAKRAERFAGLERERDQLQEAVGKLRGFEATYRKNFVSHLREQLQVVENVSVEPSAKPELADGGRDATNAAHRSQGGQNTGTPRLDALANDNQRKN